MPAASPEISSRRSMLPKSGCLGHSNLPSKHAGISNHASLRRDGNWKDAAPHDTTHEPNSPHPSLRSARADSRGSAIVPSMRRMAFAVSQPIDASDETIVRGSAMQQSKFSNTFYSFYVCRAGDRSFSTQCVSCPLYKTRNEKRQPPTPIPPSHLRHWRTKTRRANTWSNVMVRQRGWTRPCSRAPVSSLAFMPKANLVPP